MQDENFEAVSQKGHFVPVLFCGVALISENYNWNVTIFIWIMIALIGTVACFAASKKPL